MTDKRTTFIVWILLFSLLAVGSCGDLNCKVFPLNRLCTWGGE